MKYIPDGFLNDAQKAAKNEALKETAEYINRKNKHRAEKTDKTMYGDSFVGEPGAEYQSNECSVVFVFHKKNANIA